MSVEFVSKCPRGKTETGGKCSRLPQSPPRRVCQVHGYYGNRGGGGCCCCGGALRSSGGLAVFVDVHSEGRKRKGNKWIRNVTHARRKFCFFVLSLLMGVPHTTPHYIDDPWQNDHVCLFEQRNKCLYQSLTQPSAKVNDVQTDGASDKKCFVRSLGRCFHAKRLVTMYELEKHSESADLRQGRQRVL